MGDDGLPRVPRRRRRADDLRPAEGHARAPHAAVRHLPQLHVGEPDHLVPGPHGLRPRPAPVRGSAPAARTRSSRTPASSTPTARDMSPCTVGLGAARQQDGPEGRRVPRLPRPPRQRPLGRARAADRGQRALPQVPRGRRVGPLRDPAARSSPTRATRAGSPGSLCVECHMPRTSGSPTAST